ncbi:dienelactone hydrolase family protein [Armatimonas sp.]|uniref:dienelactone hydrolase family protein n=1 Tax=Armatimonas sp. TaxID=1872638 RepID=UPI00374FF811
MSQNYQDLGVYSELVDAAQRSHPLWPEARPGKATQKKLREALAFAPGDETPHDVRVERVWERDGVRGELLSWSVGYGPRTEAFYLRPSGTEGKRLPGIVALHHHGGFKLFGKEQIADGPEPVPESVAPSRTQYYGGRAYANALAKRGFAVLVPDVFLWGSRKFPLETMTGLHLGRGKKMAPEADAAQLYNITASFHEELVAKYATLLGISLAGVVSYEDRVAASYLASRPDVNARALGCVGLSGGGLRAALLQATCAKIRASVVVGMMSSFPGLLDHNVVSHTWLLYPHAWMHHGDYPDLAACRAPSPLLVQYDEADPLFTLEGMQQASARIAKHYAAVGKPENYVRQFYPGGHKFDLPMQEAAFDWLAARLG